MLPPLGTPNAPGAIMLCIAHTIPRYDYPRPPAPSSALHTAHNTTGSPYRTSYPVVSYSPVRGFCDRVAARETSDRPRRNNPQQSGPARKARVSTYTRSRVVGHLLASSRLSIAASLARCRERRAVSASNELELLIRRSHPRRSPSPPSRLQSVQSSSR